MEIILLTPENMTDALFAQMVEIEANCGLEPYTPYMLRECVVVADTYACMDSETLAGFITIQPEADYHGIRLYIANLNVAADYRRQGLAERMIRYAFSLYEHSHAGEQVILDVSKTNKPAMSLYHKLGFTISDLPSDNGDDDWVMTVPLEQLIH